MRVKAIRVALSILVHVPLPVPVPVPLPVPDSKATRARWELVLTIDASLDEEPDPASPAPKDPERCNVFALYSLFATDEEKAALAARYRAGGMGYGEAKQLLLAKIDAFFAPAR